LIVKRAISPDEDASSVFKLAFAFAGRYLFVLTLAYVILKGYPRMLIAFTVGLAIPVFAAMCEGVYEALVPSDTDHGPG
jgi:hypothetical protein